MILIFLYLQKNYCIMKMNVEDFELELYLPEPTRFYFDSALKEFHDLTDLEKVQHLAFCCANGWNMLEHIKLMFEDYDDVNAFKIRLKETLIRYIIFLRVHGNWNNDELVDKAYNILLSYTEKFHSSIEDLVDILRSELNSYVHWTLDRGNIEFEDELDIKL